MFYSLLIGIWYHLSFSLSFILDVVAAIVDALIWLEYADGLDTYGATTGVNYAEK